ncbi:SGNH hydrolase-type esterase superfamily protein, putative [Theobroma cacao]|uniref:SGNH hydrolase-type esterase superfamily protein, putative n=1 Tax=Theobroma cacao TaxID=3641 RepID=A0A061F7L3_THECC|nr:SGNH hydrolase-type esterase superfamily protein, putative [Theobroma cacao]
MSAGIPFLDAYLNERASHSSGVSFAVAGATALPVEILAKRSIIALVTKSSLSIQLDWMSKHFNETCRNDKDCFKKHKTALFMIGEFGTNDYTYALFEGKTHEEVKALVPHVVQAIKEAVRRAIDYGAVQLIVPGNLPISCLPIFLTIFQTNDTTAYDKFHSLKDLNSLSMYHNHHVQQAIEELQKENPNVIIVYGNYYQAYQRLLSRAKLLVCSNPDKSLNWDGSQLTQQAYKFMARWLIHDIYPKLQCNFST